MTSMKQNYYVYLVLKSKYLVAIYVKYYFFSPFIANSIFILCQQYFMDFFLWLDWCLTSTGDKNVHYYRSIIVWRRRRGDFFYVHHWNWSFFWIDWNYVTCKLTLSKWKKFKRYAMKMMKFTMSSNKLKKTKTIWMKIKVRNQFGKI